MRAVNSRAGFFCVKWLLRPSGLFLCYAVEQRFADHFASPARQSKIRWSPYLVGVIRQGGAISLNFAIASSEHDFREQTAKTHLASLIAAMSRHATYFGAKKVSYAGILPTVLRANRLLRGDTGAETTCRAIYQAIQDIVCQPGGRAFANLVVLGGRGTIGRQLIRHLSSHDATISIALPPIFVVDKSDGFSFNHPILLINCALPGAIEEHAASIPSHSVVLNEVYPAPNRQSIEFLTQRNIKVIHVAGVRGRAWPEFPDEYRGAIPCCAALADRELRVVVTALN